MPDQPATGRGDLHDAGSDKSLTDASDRDLLRRLFRDHDDCVPIRELHDQIGQANPGFPTERVQRETAEVTGRLLADGLLEIGGLSVPNGPLVAWRIPPQELTEMIVAAFANRLIERSGWWMFWLRMSGQGKRKMFGASVCQERVGSASVDDEEHHAAQRHPRSINSLVQLVWPPVDRSERLREVRHPRYWRAINCFY